MHVSQPQSWQKQMQDCLENLGGLAFTYFDVTFRATRKGGSKHNLACEGIDQGFGHILLQSPTIHLLNGSIEMAGQETAHQGLSHLWLALWSRQPSSSLH